MRLKEAWKIVRDGIGVRLVTGGHAPRYVVAAHFILARDEDRRIELDLTPEEAERLADDLREYAEKARRYSTVHQR